MRVFARVLARAIATATPVIQSKERLGAAAEQVTEEAIGSVSMLLEEEAVDYHFVVFPSTTCHYSITFCGKGIAPITTSIYAFTN